MKKVTGLGGIFYKVKDTESPREWYKIELWEANDDSLLDE